MAQNVHCWTLGELAQIVGGELVGPADLKIMRPVPAGDPDPAGITFAGDEKYLAKAEQSPCAAILIKPEMTTGIPCIMVADPRQAFAKILHLSIHHWATEPGIHPSSAIHESAVIDPGARVEEFAAIAADANVARGAVVGAHCFVGPGCQIGANTRLMPHVTLVQDVVVGESCCIQSGTVIGSEGFGYEWDGSKHIKVPQVGGVEIGDKVDIGSNVCIDRATAGKTRIGSGSKIDNLCQIGHNVQIGKDCVLTGMVGIGGSSVLGDRVIVGANSGITDHITICSDVMLGGRTGVTQDITEPGVYAGFPAMPRGRALKSMMLLTKLPELHDRLRALERLGGQGGSDSE